MTWRKQALEGLILRLLKKRQDIPSVEVSTNGFFLFGYYDVLEIVKAEEWMDFAPSRQHMKAENYRKYSHEIIVKLVKPPFASRIEQDSNYQSYISFSNIESLVDDGTHEGRPLLTVVFLRYARSQLNTPNTFFGSVEKTNLELAEFFKNPPREGRPIFAVYPTLGFMDAAALFLSNNYTVISKAISYLREKRDFLYTSYVIPCVSLKTENGWADVDDSDARIAINAALKQNKNPEDFFRAFDSKIGSGGENNLISTAHYETFGSIDVQSLSNENIQSMIPLIIETKESASSTFLSAPFGDILTLSDTFVLIKRDDYSEKTNGNYAQNPINNNENHDYSKDGKSDGKHTQLENGFHEMLDLISKHGYNAKFVTDRNVEGLRSMACFYFDITHSPHSFDIREIMDPALRALMRNIIASPNKNTKKEYWPNNFTPDKLNESIFAFRDTFTDLMNDYARTERRMFECRWLKHPSTASNSKLILAYHLFLRNISKYFNNSASTYNFLTVSGGVDVVVTDCLFNYVHREDDAAEHRVIIHRLPEEFLYFPSITIYRTLHEYFHFVGERERELRNKSILVSLVNYVGYCAMLLLKNEKVEYTDKFLSIFNNIPLGNELSHEQLSEIVAERNIQAEHVSTDIITNVLRLWNIEFKDDHFMSPLLDYWAPQAQERLEKLLPKICSIVKEIFNNHREKLFCKVIEVKPSCKKFYFFDNKETRTNHINWHKATEELYSEIYNTFVNNLDKGEGGINLSNILTDICSAYQEAFCDFCSVKFLESSRNNYLNSFRTEKWEYTDIRATKSILRIGSVLKACYSTGAYDTLSTGENKFDNLFNDIDDGLFKLMREHDCIISPLVAYLKKCEERLPNNIEDPEVIQMRNIYHQMQPNANTETPNCEFNINDPKSDFLSVLLEKWTEATTENECD